MEYKKSLYRDSNFLARTGLSSPGTIPWVYFREVHQISNKSFAILAVL